VIEVEDLTVRFGGVVPIDAMTLDFTAGTCGLIGPNGAGKTTFFNVLSGFVRPSAGRVNAFGEDLLAIPDFKRARWGLRRTFQTEQAIAELSVFDNVLLVHEHTGGDRTSRRDEVSEAIVGRPRVILFDEPGAGLPDDETALLAELIRRIPDETGALVVLVDHDMSLVSACCTTTAVLDFGKLIASGPTAEVLRNPHVVRAYLGTEEEV
jgi:branched-chain amino acid transport system ATP-binding protein